MGSVRVNANQDLTNEMFRSYGVPCFLGDEEKDVMAFAARCRGRRRWWRCKAVVLPTAMGHREIGPVNS
jgi:hypothetical protein